jgi:hypothetical protein
MGRLFTAVVVLLWLAPLSVGGQDPGSTAPLDARELQEKMRDDPATMNAIERLRDDPQVQKVLEDPAVLEALQEGDMGALLANPKIQRLVAHPAVQRITRDLDAKE